MIKSYIPIEIVDPLTIPDNAVTSFQLTKKELLVLTKNSDFSVVMVRMADMKEFPGTLCLIHNSMIRNCEDV